MAESVAGEAVEVAGLLRWASEFQHHNERKAADGEPSKGVSIGSEMVAFALVAENTGRSQGVRDEARATLNAILRNTLARWRKRLYGQADYGTGFVPNDLHRAVFDADALRDGDAFDAALAELESAGTVEPNNHGMVERNPYYAALAAKTGVPPWTARRADHLDLLWWPESGGPAGRKTQEFVLTHSNMRDWFMSNMYNDVYDRDVVGHPKYFDFCRMCVVAMTINRWRDDVLGDVHTLESMGRRELINLLYSHGIHFLDNLPERLQRRVLRAHHRLANSKGTSAAYREILNLFDYGDLRIRKHYLRKRETATGSAVDMAGMDMDETSPAKTEAIGETVSTAVEDMTRSDELWQVDLDTLRGMDFDFLRTKYVTVDTNQNHHVGLTRWTLLFQTLRWLALSRRDPDPSFLIPTDLSTTGQPVPVFALLAAEKVLLDSLTGAEPANDIDEDMGHGFARTLTANDFDASHRGKTARAGVERRWTGMHVVRVSNGSVRFHAQEGDDGVDPSLFAGSPEGVRLNNLRFHQGTVQAGAIPGDEHVGEAPYSTADFRFHDPGGEYVGPHLLGNADDWTVVARLSKRGRKAVAGISLDDPDNLEPYVITRDSITNGTVGDDDLAFWKMLWDVNAAGLPNPDLKVDMALVRNAEWQHGTDWEKAFDDVYGPTLLADPTAVPPEGLSLRLGRLADNDPESPDALSPDNFRARTGYSTIEEMAAMDTLDEVLAAVESNTDLLFQIEDRLLEDLSHEERMVLSRNKAKLFHTPPSRPESFQSSVDTWRDWLAQEHPNLEYEPEEGQTAVERIDTIVEIVDGWLTSPLHARANILSSNVTEEAFALLNWFKSYQDHIAVLNAGFLMGTDQENRPRKWDVLAPGLATLPYFGKEPAESGSALRKKDEPYAFAHMWDEVWSRATHPQYRRPEYLPPDPPLPGRPRTIRPVAWDDPNVDANGAEVARRFDAYTIRRILGWEGTEPVPDGPMPEWISDGRAPASADAANLRDVVLRMLVTGYTPFQDGGDDRPADRDWLAPFVALLGLNVDSLRPEMILAKWNALLLSVGLDPALPANALPVYTEGTPGSEQSRIEATGGGRQKGVCRILEDLLRSPGLARSPRHGTRASVLRQRIRAIGQRGRTHRGGSPSIQRRTRRTLADPAKPRRVPPRQDQRERPRGRRAGVVPQPAVPEDRRFAGILLGSKNPHRLLAAAAGGRERARGAKAARGVRGQLLAARVPVPSDNAPSSDRRNGGAVQHPTVDQRHHGERASERRDVHADRPLQPAQHGAVRDRRAAVEHANQGQIHRHRRTRLQPADAVHLRAHDSVQRGGR